MKYTFYLSKLFLSLSLLLMFSSCNSDNAIISIDAQIIEISEIAKSGTWHISSYVDSGQDETNDYSGFDFVFNTDGTLSATNGTTVINGSWSVTEDDDSSNNDNDVDFNISFNSPPNFEELSDDWDIVSITNTKIDLIDVSGGNGGTDTLTFTKN